MSQSFRRGIWSAYPIRLRHSQRREPLASQCLSEIVRRRCGARNNRSSTIRQIMGPAVMWILLNERCRTEGACRQKSQSGGMSPPLLPVPPIVTKPSSQVCGERTQDVRVIGRRSISRSARRSPDQAKALTHKETRWITGQDKCLRRPHRGPWQPRIRALQPVRDANIIECPPEQIQRF